MFTCYVINVLGRIYMRENECIYIRHSLKHAVRISFSHVFIYFLCYSLMLRCETTWLFTCYFPCLGHCWDIWARCLLICWFFYHTLVMFIFSLVMFILSLVCYAYTFSPWYYVMLLAMLVTWYWGWVGLHIATVLRFGLGCMQQQY